MHLLAQPKCARLSEVLTTTGDASAEKLLWLAAACRLRALAGALCDLVALCTLPHAHLPCAPSAPGTAPSLPLPDADTTPPQSAIATHLCLPDPALCLWRPVDQLSLMHYPLDGLQAAWQALLQQ